MKRFLNLIVYILTIHVSALLIAGLFRLVLFISSYHQLTSEALSDKTLPMLAFVHGVWFDNVIGCYILSVASGSCGGMWSLQLLWESVVPFLYDLFQCLLWIGLFNQCVGHSLFCLFL